MKEKFVRDRRTVTPEEFRKTIAKIAEGRGEPCRAEKAFEKRILESEEDIEK